MDLGLYGKRALVCGSSSGLGKAVARALVQEGAKVAIVSRSAERLKAAAIETGAGMQLVSDLDQPGAGKAVVDEVVRAWGGVDVLVTNTGGPPKGKFLEVTNAQWQVGFQALWLSAVESIQAALPGMIERKWGRVLLITSVAAKEPIAGLTVSNGLRAGLLGLTKTLALEVADKGVTVNALLPGYTKTERLVELGVTDEQIASSVPARRLATPEEFGALAAFVASDRAGYLTAQALSLDGGWLRGI
ncbi:MAG: SDR family oxidoreductase [Deltaproteobacteria bacterium]|nr:SDR family oxidoreductase [Deltaproteobacteria bacterium]